MNFMFLIAGILIILGIVGYEEVESATSTQIRHTSELYQAQTAQEGVALFNACLESTAPSGTYTPQSLIAASGGSIDGYSVGQQATLPLGNQWQCIRQSGGSYGNNIVTVSWNGPMTIDPAVNGTPNITDQIEMAYAIMSQMTPLIVGQPSTALGILAPTGTVLPNTGSPGLTSNGKTLITPPPASIAISFLVNPVTYVTPAIVANIQPTAPPSSSIMQRAMP
jgi:hypothetical protein